MTHGESASRVDKGHALTLADLPVHLCCMSDQALTEEVRRTLKENLELPGIIVVNERNRFVGLVSQTEMAYQFSKPYGESLYAKRPIRAMLPAVRPEPLLFPETERIMTVAKAALHRPKEAVYEPIVVIGNRDNLRLLDVHTLLLAQYQLLSRAYQTIRKQKDSAEEATRAKSAFLANMSHEIRTPMTAILGYADLLRDPSISPADRLNYTDTIRRNGKHLLQIINDILDLSKIEAGKMAAEYRPTDLPQLLQDVISMTRPQAINKNIDLDLKMSFPLPGTIQTDPLRLRQVLMNLVTNAIKFTRAGRVELRVSFDTSLSDQPKILLEVEDTGIGISSAQLARLFQPFCQGDESTSRKYGGTGLGLTISRRLAELLGGAITVDSEPGVGSTFRLTVAPGTLNPEDLVTDAAQLEYMPSARDNDVSATPASLQGRVLLAEDGPDNLRLISFILRKAGLVVDVADNGRIAVDLATEAMKQDEPYDLILMDMQMPEMDGYEATRLLRRGGYTQPIVALTAHALTRDRQLCLDAGCDDYAIKPINRACLVALAKRFIAQDATSAVATT